MKDPIPSVGKISILALSLFIIATCGGSLQGTGPGGGSGRDTEPPVVAITQPQDGAELGDSVVTVAADASDNVGVAEVAFVVDGSVPPGAVDTTTPYEYIWDISALPDSSRRQLVARARDTAGNSSSSDTVTVRVIRPNPPQVEPTRVVVLLIDGARYSETVGDSTRTHINFMWNYMKPLGTLFSNFRNEGQTSTNPGHASIATGTWQYIANDGSERPDMPTFFEYFRQELARPQSQCYMITGKSKLNVISYSIHPDYGSAYGSAVDAVTRSDEATMQAAFSILASDHPLLTFINLADVDRAGHSGIWFDYLSAIETADSLAYELWQFLQADTFYSGKTVLFVTNDHGRHDDAHGGFVGHGDGCEGCRHIMLLALGPGVRQDYIVGTAYTQIDICPTVGSIIGFTPVHAAGRVIADMFTSAMTISPWMR